jgi:hypothetical protein
MKVLEFLLTLLYLTPIALTMELFGDVGVFPSIQFFQVANLAMWVLERVNQNS